MEADTVRGGRPPGLSRLHTDRLGAALSLRVFQKQKSPIFLVPVRFETHELEVSWQTVNTM